MNLVAGIVVAIVGILLVILSVTKIVHGLTWTGITLILLGLLMAGLSFVPKPSTEGTGKMSTLETLGGIFYSPGEVFQNLKYHPRWLVAVLVMTIFSTAYLNIFFYRLTPERITNYTVDKTLKMPMLANNEEARKQVEAGRPQAIEDNKNPVLRVGQAVTAFVGQVFLFAFFGGVFFLFALAMGGSINFWQAFSVAVYAFFPITIIRAVLNTVILFVKDPIDVHPILGQSSLIQDSLNFLITPSDSPVLFVLLGSISLLSFYWIWLNGTGLKNAGERVSSSTAWTATLTIYLIGVSLGVVVSYLFPSFFS